MSSVSEEHVLSILERNIAENLEICLSDKEGSNIKVASYRFIKECCEKLRRHKPPKVFTWGKDLTFMPMFIMKEINEHRLKCGKKGRAVSLVAACDQVR